MEFLSTVGNNFVVEKEIKKLPLSNGVSESNLVELFDIENLGSLEITTMPDEMPKELKENIIHYRQELKDKNKLSQWKERCIYDTEIYTFPEEKIFRRTELEKYQIISKGTVPLMNYSEIVKEYVKDVMTALSAEISKKYTGYVQSVVVEVSENISMILPSYNDTSIPKEKRPELSDVMKKTKNGKKLWNKSISFDERLEHYFIFPGREEGKNPMGGKPLSKATFFDFSNKK
ncbi:MAG: hypothetical protein GY828_03160 [Candidatus Gracilibacteria bacterium]|nr:hypothetical protein [Candidatus Gracilibacteria bacterium]